MPEYEEGDDFDFEEGVSEEDEDWPQTLTLSYFIFKNHFQEQPNLAKFIYFSNFINLKR